MRAALHALTDADLERVALIDRSGRAGEAKVATVRGMMRVVMRRTDDHIASIRGAMAGAA
jgi:hypothetical protein